MQRCRCTTDGCQRHNFRPYGNLFPQPVCGLCQQGNHTIRRKTKVVTR